MWKELLKPIITKWEQYLKIIKQFFNRDDNDPYGSNPYVII